MLRLAGSVMLGAACAMYGAGRASSLKCRRDFLCGFVTSLSVLDTEISFGRRTLGDIFVKLSDPKLCGLYKKCAAEMGSMSVKEAWRRSVEHAAAEAELKPDDLDAVTSLGAELGRSDAEGHKKAIERTAALVSALAADADAEYKRLGRVYRSCGVLAGVMCVIIFM